MENDNTTDQTNEQQPVKPPQPPIESMVEKKTLPNSVAVLVLGIVSIPTCICYGIVGLACGIIALVLAGKAKTLYMDNPGLYTEGSYKNMSAGKVCAIIGVILSGLIIIYFIVIVLFLGALITSMPWDQFNF